MSWLRSSDVSVLTVGSYVFSSDPRIAVGVGQNGSSWALSIIWVVGRDEGEYQCQANTEPKISYAVRLSVRTQDMVDNEQSTSAKNTVDLEIAKQIPFLRIAPPVTTIPTTIAPATTTSPTSMPALKVSQKDKSDNPEEEELLKHNPPTLAPEPPNPNEASSDILLLPILCFSAAVLLVIGVGSVRGLYSRWKNPKPPPRRPRSRTGTIDSRRSSGSRRSHDSN